jgi:predicted DNA-binding transcriptional regulator YafY
MYGGRRENVRIRFVNTLLDTVYDRFGDYASYFIEDDRHFTVSVSVEISPMFFGWLCGFGNKAVLLSPDAVIEEFLKHVDKMYEKYKQS